MAPAPPTPVPETVTGVLLFIVLPLKSSDALLVMVMEAALAKAKVAGHHRPAVDGHRPGEVVDRDVEGQFAGTVLGKTADAGERARTVDQEIIGAGHRR